jgi:hypothetical protein
MNRGAVVILMGTAIACGGSTPSPSSQLTASLPAAVSSRSVTCATCQQPPFSWQTADVSVGITDPTGRGGTIASVDAVVRNVTRKTELGKNRLPNAGVGLVNASVPASGMLTVVIGVTFDNPAAASDELQITVTVTLTDGRTAAATSRVTSA